MWNDFFVAAPFLLCYCWPFSSMDSNAAVPPSLRCSSRETLQVQSALGDSHNELDEPENSDDASPPPTARGSASIGDTPKLWDRKPSKTPQARAIPPVPRKNPLRLVPFHDPSLEPGVLRVEKHSVRNFSHPLKNQPPDVDILPYRDPPRPSPKLARPLVYHSSQRVPLNLRRRSSLETIESVETTQDCHTAPEPKPEPRLVSVDGSCNYLSYDEADSSLGQQSSHEPPLAAHSSNPSRHQSSSIHNQRGRPSLGSPSTLSLLRKLGVKKTLKPVSLADYPGIEKRVSFDQHSYCTHSSSSVRISPGKASELQRSASRSRASQEIGEWKASDYDTSGLNEAELKKCIKRGANPALYAEMKAARKGKWISPISGNTFL
ncbi:hypothetical protein CC78DRAFT_540310 [Lojkania enalia]|uniref:Uncharacterized protein n=1 Tax=Lojkania enalia TaxID=147567 RepID=A0A9P4N9Z8_9PLEO|nr:hypothetical protein CC78DRAFT_540310 [Didymosphaeria enalia]